MCPFLTYGYVHVYKRENFSNIEETPRTHWVLVTAVHDIDASIQKVAEDSYLPFIVISVI